MSRRIDPELIAMRAVQRALDPLGIPERDRVVNWVRERYTPTIVNMAAEWAEEKRKGIYRSSNKTKAG